MARELFHEVTDFWLAPETRAKWFVKDPAFDAEVARRLQSHHERALAGRYDGWRDTAEGCLALAVLFDQVPRNLFRGSARAFASDPQARAVARHALERGYDKGLDQWRRLILYLPFEHSEEPADQELCCRLVAALDEHPDWLRYAEARRDLVARFGRFPHRNAALGRASTAQEECYLAQPDAGI
ncbi:MAG: DUF924 family protein [Kiloniellales bacterium]